MNKEKFKTWIDLEYEFKKNFSNKESEIIAWDKIQNIRQTDYKYIEDLELELEELFIKAKIDDEKVKWDCLLSSLESKNKRIILEKGIHTSKRTIDHIKGSEKLDRVMEVGMEGSKIGKEMEVDLDRKIV
ncbi:hypothetical protein AYI69_g4630 [Smittium culicis]|nr:hypothetical protein AYI69_g4630 [Smittium culicis]